MNGSIEYDRYRCQVLTPKQQVFVSIDGPTVMLNTGSIACMLMEQYYLLTKASPLSYHDKHDSR